jgi:hypothetical protein
MDTPDVLRATKLFTEQVLTPEFMGGPIWNRSYRKPFGYPGDFQMMNYVYEWLPRGATVYEKLLHRLGLWMCWNASLRAWSWPNIPLLVSLRAVQAPAGRRVY